MRLLTKRLFTELHGRTGMKPTRALMDAVCKYKQFWKPSMEKHFLYGDQRECVNFMHDGLSVSQQSIECQIMDWSDDIANAYADVNDGVKARLINISSLEKWAASQELDPQDDTELRKLLESIKKGDTEKLRSRGIGECITATAVVSRSNPLASKTWRYSHGIEIIPQARKKCELMKRIARGIVIQSALVQQLEMKTHRMLKSLFELLLENYSNGDPKSLLPHDAHVEVTSATDRAARARFICDHLSGMSDDFAVRTYRRLFDPLFGSLGDFI